MTEQNPNPVVVAVGHDPIDTALAFAASEANRLGCGLHLVHVVHRFVQGPETTLVSETDLERAGRLALNAALEKVRDLVAPDVTVTSDLRVGAVVPTLVEMAADARMIVLQHRDLSRMMRVVTRSVSSGVAARTRVPVVVVPSAWSPEPKPGAQPKVTVGIDAAARCHEVLRAAGAEASSRGARLHVLHTWSFPSPYEDIVMTRSEDEAWAKRATAEIQTELATMWSEWGDLPIEIDARHAYAADALIEASRAADLLVIGQHDPLVPVGSHLGPIARAVVRAAECPVLLADPRPGRGWTRHGEKAGEIRAQHA